jgi:hypothetical protein
MIYPVDDSVIVSTSVSAKTYAQLVELAQVQGSSEQQILRSIVTRQLNPAEADDD